MEETFDEAVTMGVYLSECTDLKLKPFYKDYLNKINRKDLIDE